MSGAKSNHRHNEGSAENQPVDERTLHDDAAVRDIRSGARDALVSKMGTQGGGSSEDVVNDSHAAEISEPAVTPEQMMDFMRGGADQATVERIGRELKDPASFPSRFLAALKQTADNVFEVNWDRVNSYGSDPRARGDGEGKRGKH